MKRMTNEGIIDDMRETGIGRESKGHKTHMDSMRNVQKHKKSCSEEIYTR